MRVIDDDGNLFGVVNVIDALAVVLVLTVIVAGVAVVGVLGDGEPESRYATIDLGSQPDHLVDRVAPGDRMVLEGYDHELTITDVYVSVPQLENESDAHLMVRTQVNGERTYDERWEEDVFEFGGERLRVGHPVTLETLEYVVEGEVTALDREGETFSITETSVLLEATVPVTTADEIGEGDEHRLSATPVATVTSVRTYPVGADQRRVLLGVDLATLDRDGTPTFGGQPVATGSTLRLSTGAYDLEGEVVRRGTTDEPGEPTTTIATVELENVPPSVADSLAPGMAEIERGETLATIRDVETRPAKYVIESEDGDIHLRDHPVNEDVTLIVELQTRETESGLRFHGDSLREGDPITLDFGFRIVQGDVTRLDRGGT